jgi:hypothetical protein
MQQLINVKHFTELEFDRQGFVRSTVAQNNNVHPQHAYSLPMLLAQDLGLPAASPCRVSSCVVALLTQDLFFVIH